MKYYVVRRHSPDQQNIHTSIIAGPYDSLNEADNVSLTCEKADPNEWYEVWDEGALIERGYL